MVRDYIQSVFEHVVAKNPAEPEFHQAVREVFDSLGPCLAKYPEFKEAGILERLVEPERAVMFRVPWRDDRGKVRVNRGFRVQFNSAIGPYKGGLRFHPSVTLSIVKFLGFEQIFKNALTTLALGGAKGGSDFDPKGKSDTEIESFCRSFMLELFRHIGPTTDVPAGDIGVGTREIGLLFGVYRKVANQFNGTLTGKGFEWGGSRVRPEATGYGSVYFADEMLTRHADQIAGKICLVSGAGNVAQYTIEKLNHLGAKAISVSDSTGIVIDRDGIDAEKLEWLKHLKNVARGRLSEYVQKFTNAQYRDFSGTGPNPLWAVEGAQCAFPSATQNEIAGADAQIMVKNGVKLVCEGSNMATTPDGIACFHEHRVLYAPGKAANAGGVATSGLEMAQNAGHTSWGQEEVDRRLREIMHAVHKNCFETAAEYGAPDNYEVGANIAGFLKVARAMLDQGIHA